MTHTAPSVDVSQLLGSLAGIIHLMGATDFFAEVLAREEKPVLHPEPTGFSIRFADGYSTGITEFRGALFGDYTDSKSHCRGQIVHGTATARELFDRVIEQLTAAA